MNTSSGVKSKKALKKGYALVRVSSEIQADVQHGSLEQQRHMIERWAHQQAEKTGCVYQIVKVIEEDVSGRGKYIQKRPELRTLESAIENGEIDFFVFEKIDRVARDQIYNLTLVKLAQEYNVEVHEFESGLINLRDRGSRLGFHIKNMMAEEYSLDLEEKVTKKFREARVNNGKDTSTCPILGLDPHPTMRGMYVKNDREILIVEDIMKKFVELRSYIDVARYCQQKGYKTKSRIVKEKVDRNGRIIPPKKVGGEDFTAQKIKLLITNPKYRGYAHFRDTWNQFPKLQDENGVVKWNYSHGALIDTALLDSVINLVRTFEGKKPLRGKYNDFVLSGLITDETGAPYWGASFKYGANQYYQAKGTFKRFSREILDQKVCNRVKQYLRESGTVERIMNSTLNNRQIGVPFIDEEIVAQNKKISELKAQQEGVAKAFRSVGLESHQNMSEILNLLIAEKTNVEKELHASEIELKKLTAKKEGLKKHFKGVRLQDFLNRTCAHFDSLEGSEKRRIIRAVLPKILIQSDNKLVLFVNPDPDNVWKGQPASSSSEFSSPTITVEDENSKNKTNGCGGLI